MNHERIRIPIILNDHINEHLNMPLYSEKL